MQEVPMNIHLLFNSYVQEFLDKNEDEEYRDNIILKKEHSIRVSEEIIGLGRELGLDHNSLALVEIMGLFHDIGRFEQFHRYKTFNDSVSENHAALGVKIIKERGFADFLDPIDLDLVLSAIAYHNRAHLPEDLPERTLWFSKLLRDADKLDIWKVVTDYYARRDEEKNQVIELDLPDTPGVSETVYRDLMNKQVVAFHHMRSLNDFKLLQLGWIFDVNFPATLQRVRDRNYMEKIRAVLPDEPRVKEVFDSILQHIQKKLDESSSFRSHATSPSARQETTGYAL
jgi:putative nucleotidyltransferase with HDIG domain